MWSSTNQRIKALMSARAREKDRLTRPIHVRRADVTLSFRDDRDFLVTVPAHAILNDFTPIGFCIYAATPLNPNAEVVVEVEHPKRFRLSAKIVWCGYQPSSARIITPDPFPYRIGLALIWDDTALETEFKKYCDELSGLYVNKKGLFLEEVFKHKPAAEAVAAAPVAGVPVKDPLDVPPPTESDEGGAPSEEKVAAEMAAAAAAEIASQALKQANPEPAAPAAAADTSATDVLNALKDIDVGGSAPVASSAPAAGAAPAAGPAPAAAAEPAATDEKKAA